MTVDTDYAEDHPTRQAVIEAVGELGPTHQAKIAEAVGVTDGMASIWLIRLEEEGLVERRVDLTQPNRKVVELTGEVNAA